MDSSSATTEHVREVGRAVRAEAAALAADWRARDEAAWEAPSACTGWTVRDVAAHVADGAERAVLVLDTALAGGEVPQFNTQERRRRHAAMRELPGPDLARRVERDLAAVFEQLESLPADTLRHTVVPMGGGPHTLAQFADQRLVETALHAWDVRAGGDPGATIAPESAAAMIDFVLWRVPRLAEPGAGGAWAPRYQFELAGPGGGPVTLEVGPDRVTATRSRGEPADMTLRLSVEAFIRLVWGRLAPEQAWARGDLGSQSPRDEIIPLRELFPGH
jgi:uncharacterized protein (TIGR03083 family)